MVSDKSIETGIGIQKYVIVVRLSILLQILNLIRNHLFLVAFYKRESLLCQK